MWQCLNDLFVNGQILEELVPGLQRLVSGIATGTERVEHDFMNSKDDDLTNSMNA